MRNNQNTIWIFILLLSGLIGCYSFNSSIDENHLKRKVILTGNATITGYVFDENQKPILGASIYVTNTKLGSVSDSSGYYQINKIPYGNHIVRFSRLLCTSSEESIYVFEDSMYLMDTIILKIDSNKVKSIGKTHIDSFW